MSNWFKKNYPWIVSLAGLLAFFTGFALFYPSVIRHFAPTALKAYGVQNLEFAVERPTISGWVVNDVSFRVVLDDSAVKVRAKQLELQYRFLQLLKGVPSGLVLSTATIESDYGTLAIDALSLALKSGENTGADGTALLKGLLVQVDGHTIPRINGTAEFRVRDREANATLRLRGAEIPFVLIGAAQYRRHSETMKLSLSLLPLEWSVLKLLLNHFEVQLPKGLSLAQLRSSGHIGADWSAEGIENQFLSLKLTEMSGKYRDTLFSGAEIRVGGAGFVPLRLPKPIEIRIAELNPGLPIREISGKLQVSYKKKRLKLRGSDVSAHLLNGRLEVPQLTFDMSGRKGQTSVLLKRLDLAEIVKLYPQKAIFASGTVSGKLPVNFFPTGVTISSGSIHSDSNGVLRATLFDTQETSTALEKSLGIAASALENYHYDSLEAAADLDRAGDLQLQLSLKGKNPEFQNGRPIHFTVTVNENIPALLKSLRITSEMADFGSGK